MELELPKVQFKKGPFHQRRVITAQNMDWIVVINYKHDSQNVLKSCMVVPKVPSFF